MFVLLKKIYLVLYKMSNYCISANMNLLVSQTLLVKQTNTEIVF